MNKWIPISLLVFLGIYLLTTEQAPVTDFQGKQVAETLSSDFNKIYTAIESLWCEIRGRTSPDYGAIPVAPLFQVDLLYYRLKIGTW